jgi:hypothetical protein
MMRSGRGFVAPLLRSIRAMAARTLAQFALGGHDKRFAKAIIRAAATRCWRSGRNLVAQAEYPLHL